MPKGTPRIAIVVNKNARSVTAGVIDDIRDTITDEKLFVSHSSKSLRQAAQSIVKDGFDVVVSAGGDGTFAQTVTAVMNAGCRTLPAFGVLRLGTGNGVAEALRVAPFNRETLLEELRQAKNPEARIGMSMLKINGYYAPFAGTGVDANILRDYRLIRKILALVPFLPEKGRGLIDYALAITTMSFWRYAFSKLPEVVIRNGGAKAHRIDYHGHRVGMAKDPGDVLYRGPVLFAGASTVRYYGFDIPIFPQASSLFGGYFQLRVCAMEAPEALTKLLDILAGKLADDKLWDFSCKDITIETPDGLPFQVGGDPAGKHKKMRIASVQIQAVQGSAAAAPEPPK